MNRTASHVLLRRTFQRRLVRVALLWAAVISLVATSLGACTLFESDGGEVTVTKKDGALIVFNGTLQRVWTFAVGARIQARLYWVPQVGEGGIAPGKRKRIEVDDIPMDEGETTVIVYWWHAVVEDGELAPGEVHRIVVEL